MRDKILNYIEKFFPESFHEISGQNLIKETLFSNFQLELPIQVLTQVQQFANIIYQIKDSNEYQRAIGLPDNFQNWQDTPSLFSCFDFHYSKDSGLKLIEINTNASLYLPLAMVYQVNKDPNQQLDLASLLTDFQKSFKLEVGDGLSIMDLEPNKEGLFFEFLLIREWLSQQGVACNIIARNEFSNKAFKNIYNRLTDFYFSDAESAELKQAYYQEHSHQFSPNPREYFLMADKKRLQPLRKMLSQHAPEFEHIIPETKQFSEFESKDELWSKRKKYFFKPSDAYGGKAAFSGKSISKKAFEGIYDPNFIAQELCPAGKQKFDHGDESVEMKFDLRFYCFEGQINNFGARLYQGQTTNMKTPLGGLAAIEFS